VLAACKEFARWGVEQEFASVDPLAAAKPVNVRVDPRRIRRALTLSKLRKLLRLARSGPGHKGLSGPVRARGG